MTEALVKLTIDDKEVSVPAGTLIVDAAKKVGIDIPVFCYHPKLKPVGMCRMCLVEVGRPAWDRAKNAPILDEDGQPVIQFGPNLETACTTPVGEGWVVRVESEKARLGRKQIVEYILTSHPLDCPICDKGGECPLQNLTMEHGPGKSRFLFEEKMHLDKHVPLGELIFLDRERCIQCGRCTRYQDEVVGQPVIGFKERGRSLEIVTYSNPGFDSYFSGNTTDICPVGALTTADFRFGARPWEMSAAASICTHCPVGCNLALNTRREARSGGREVVKRVMPRQNEWVNEIWICDKGRFAHHFAGSPDRISQPMVRKRGKLVETTWEEALTKAAQGLKAASNVVGIAGGRASNEDLYLFRRLIEELGGKAILDDRLGGGDLVQAVGVGKGTQLGELGRGDAVLVIASDLHEEAPLWWLRVKQASDRGSAVVVANARTTSLDEFASHILRYRYPEAVAAALGLLHAASGRKDLSTYAGDADIAAAGKALAAAENLVIFYGGEGLDYADTQALAQACASLLVATGHTSRANNGLIAVWPRSNTMGAWEAGLRPQANSLEETLKGAQALLVMAADPFGDQPALVDQLDSELFLVVQELFLSPTAQRADVVLPAQSFIERDGSYTSGERRVQRTYRVVPPLGEAMADWRILAMLAGQLGIEFEANSTAAVLLEIGKTNPAYAALTYEELAQTEWQWPQVGGDDLYFGGTAYKNHQGTGVQLTSVVERGGSLEAGWSKPVGRAPKDGFLLVPCVHLYDRGTTVMPSEVLHPRLMAKSLALSPEDGRRLGLQDGGEIEVHWDGRVERMPVRVVEGVPLRVALLPRSLGVALLEPVAVQLKAVEGREKA